MPIEAARRRIISKCAGWGAALSGCIILSTAALAQSEQVPNCAANYDGPVIAGTTVSLPKVGEEREVEIGQSVISTFSGSLIGGPIDLLQGTSITGKFFGKSYTVEIPPGHYVPELNNFKWEYFIKDAVFRYGSGSPRHGIGKPDTVLTINSSGILTAWVKFGFKTAEFALPNEPFSTIKCLSMGDAGFRRELLYSGVSKGTISLEYKEFSNNLARPAFSQEVKYDLSEGNEVGFKGARILVIKATNTSVRYKVIRGIE